MAVVASVVSLLLVSITRAGVLFEDWPDVIICKKTASDGSTVEYDFIIAIVNRSKTDGCSEQMHDGYNMATYAPMHFHFGSTSEGLRAEPESVFMFCGATAETAVAVASPRIADDCEAGVTISELRRRGQVRDLGP
jgi:hypothetical protein